MTLVRSLAFNILHYAVTVVMLIGSLPVFAFASQETSLKVVRLWARIGVFLLRVVAGTRLEIRGLENLPEGGAIIAAKHQSMYETFALFPLFKRPAFVVKQELERIPLWGWYMKRTGMIAVDRDEGMTALRNLATAVRAAIDRHRQVVIFPEGTRRAPGAPPDYKGGIAHLYRMAAAPVVPVALNSGLYWARRHLSRHPGTIVVEFLPPILPGLKSKDFLEKLQAEIETASDRLLLEADGAVPRPPFPPEATARLEKLRQG